MGGAEQRASWVIYGLAFLDYTGVALVVPLLPFAYKEPSHGLSNLLTLNTHTVTSMTNVISINIIVGT